MKPRDPEKAPDVAFHAVAYAGVQVVSRYAKRREFETMMSALDHVADHAPPGVLAMIMSLWCDSKAQATYTVRCAHSAPPFRCFESELQQVADALDIAFRSVSDGHNGVYVECDGLRAAAGPWWFGDDKP